VRQSIARLASRAARDPSRYGGKGAGLARLAALGFNVPPGFLLPTRALQDHLASLADHHDDLPDRILQADLPPPWRRRLAAVLRRLDGPVAVRSSLVGEDSPYTSLAGQLLTVLDVDGEEALFDAVKRCWASAFAPRVVEYRRGMRHRRDGSPEPATDLPAMALVIQRMQPGVVGGVAFSADPLSGRRCVIVEAATGRLDGVVSGTVTPARWVVDARGKLTGDHPDDCGQPPLAEAEVLELAGAVRRIAAARTCPVDVEWLHDGERFWFLQARPISSLMGKHIYSNRLVADMSPGLIKPLLWSTNTRAITLNVFGRLFDELIGPNGVDYTRLVRRIHSRLYCDVTRLGELMIAVGLPANFFEMMARDERGERPRMPRRYMLRMLRYAPFLWRNVRMEKALRRFVAEQDAALEPFRRVDWAARPLSSLPPAADQLLELHGRSQWFTFLAALNLMLRRRLLERGLRRHVPGVAAQDLLQCNASLCALEPNEMLQAIGRLARGLPSAQRRVLEEGDDQRIRASLDTTAEGRELITAVDTFMDRYGFLSANGTDFSSASWVEQPTLIWRSVARQALAAENGEAPSRPVAGQETVDAVVAQVPRLQRRMFRRFLASTRAYLDLRERVSFLFSEDTYQFRRVVLAVGDQLTAAGRLETRNDVFHLFKDELWQLVAGELSGEEARRLVAARRVEMAADAACEPEETFCGEDHQLATPPPLAAADHLVGIGGSAGTVEGYARIVRDPLAAPVDLGKQDILVVPFTDVGWTPLLAGIGGIVAEAGGQLSHTAIVAREYALPAVVGVRRATQELQDGEAITVDGRRGLVFRGHVLAQQEEIA